MLKMDGICVPVSRTVRYVYLICKVLTYLKAVQQITIVIVNVTTMVSADSGLCASF